MGLAQARPNYFKILDGRCFCCCVRLLPYGSWRYPGSGFSRSRLDSGPPDFCLDISFHKPVPGPEDESLHECLAWQNLSCCDTEVTELISDSIAVELYNLSWAAWDRYLCSEFKPPSQSCEKFIKVCVTDSCMHRNGISYIMQI